ncbi:helix-turn-helix transcriptional regulator [Allokutzneria oryzae]|uniref:Response regulator transcription factor n=1 Tax=Allokutzneria oryzae TaxID=1378989 RepID=A0ABV5ZXA8_9PSEU
MTRDDRTAIRGALLQLRRDTGLPVAFGGPLTSQRRLTLTELVGTATDSLRGLAVAPGSGLGGKVVSLGRVVAVSDYPTASVITHDYDAAVGAEGLRAIVAVPVVVRRSVRAVLYAATRRSATLGDRLLGAAVGTARMLEQDLAVQDEVDDRVARMTSALATRDRASGAEWEAVRLAHAELRLIAQRTADPALRAELHGVCEQLTSPPSGPTVRLTPREIDVLTGVAAGCGNAEIARRLRLGPETVKSYLREAMRKLDVHSRGEAVVAARRAGLLP